MVRLIVIFSLALLFFSCAPKEQPFDLIDRDQTCTIVLELGDYASVEAACAAYDSIDWFDADNRDDDICRQALAAIELQDYLSRIIGVPKQQIPIVDTAALPDSGHLVLLGSPQHDDLSSVRRQIKRAWRKHKSANDQALRIDSFYRHNYQGLVLSGRSSVAILYAVYELLNRWGVRWYAPDKNGEYVPHYAKIGIHNMHLYVEPSFRIRGFWMDAQRIDEPADSLFISWMGRNHLNLFSNLQDNIGALKQRGVLLNTGRTDVFLTLLRPEYQYRYNHPTFQGDEQYPMDPYIISEYFKGDTNRDDKLSYTEAHPEWFGIEADTSDHRRVAAGFSHICLSQPEAIREFVQTIVDKLCYGDWQTCDIIDLWTPEIWCTCEHCQRMGNDSDKLLYLMYHLNRALAAARKKETLQRRVFVHGYAQNSALDPPSIALPKDFATANSALFLFTGPRCFNHCIIDAKCIDINIWFAKNLWSWLGKKKLYDGDIYIAENYNASYFHNLPTLHSTVMSIDIQDFAELGVRGINFQHVRLRKGGVQVLTNYQFARQAWDAHVPTDTLKQEFFTLLYPAVSKTVADYMERLELALSTITTWCYYLPQRDYASLKGAASTGSGLIKMNERFVERTSDAIDFNSLWENTYHLIFEARFLMDELLAENVTEDVRRRIEELDEELQYAERMIHLYDNVISYFTRRPDEKYIKDEAIYRLNENMRRLRHYEIPEPMFGEANVLAASGIQDMLERLIEEEPK
ncbi:DUF4838 domain-containing protein [candidate division KSB1 bacterium]|nr:DUF4838 domain-containing protein [candidate division KSB1 bacterium]RQW11061.1 MAG: DUF4838 domain-containing protein [candidate division KSB1 bacterium]